MKRIQSLQPEDYWTQRRNAGTPAVECQVTSAANWIMAKGLYPAVEPGIPSPGNGGKQRLPDFIDDVANSPEAQAIAREDGWQGNPREDHRVLEWAINKVVGSRVNIFTKTFSMCGILVELAAGRPVIISGQFGTYRDAAGTNQPRYHVVCATGIEYDVDPSQGTILVADPYGDYHTNYVSQKGAECRFRFSELMDILHDANTATKWAHVST